jgi:hypothetical protein
MLRFLILCAGLNGALAAESSATDLAADVIATRAEELTQRGDTAVARHLERLATELRANRISIPEAQQVLMLAQSLPPLPPVLATQPSMAAARAQDVLDGRPVPPPVIAPAPAPIVAPTAVITPLAPLAAARFEPTLIGKVLAIEPGSEGRPAVIAFATDPRAGIKEGQRVAVRRKHATIALARIGQVKPELTFALLILGTWSDGTGEIHVDDEIALVDQ